MRSPRSRRDTDKERKDKELTFRIFNLKGGTSKDNSDAREKSGKCGVLEA